MKAIVMNRIQQWWREMLQWKEKLENLFRSMGITPGRSFGKEELRMYDRLLSKRISGMTPEERLTRSMVRSERRKLIRQLYPNPFVRLGRGLFRLGGRLAGRMLSGLIPDSTGLETDDTLRRLGLSQMKPDKTAASLKETYSESPRSGEVMDFKIKLEEDLNGNPVIRGYEAVLTSAGGKKEQLFIHAGTGIDKHRARELLHGRSVHVGGDKWLVPDANDRDADGNMKLREIAFPGYDVVKELAQLPGIRIQGTELEKAAAELMDGKRVDIPVNRNGNPETITLEAQPLKRSFAFYRNNRKVSPEHPADKSVNENTKVLQMDTSRKQRIKV